jgi:hypothetical protein
VTNDNDVSVQITIPLPSGANSANTTKHSSITKSTNSAKLIEIKDDKNNNSLTTLIQTLHSETSLTNCDKHQQKELFVELSSENKNKDTSNNVIMLRQRSPSSKEGKSVMHKQIGKAQPVLSALDNLVSGSSYLKVATAISSQTTSSTSTSTSSSSSLSPSGSSVSDHSRSAENTVAAAAVVVAAHLANSIQNAVATITVSTSAATTN